jgi:hypothetical protein
MWSSQIPDGGGGRRTNGNFVFAKSLFVQNFNIVHPNKMNKFCFDIVAKKNLLVEFTPILFKEQLFFCVVNRSNQQALYSRENSSPSSYKK